MTAFIVTSIQPFTEISKDSTGFPAFGEFRSMAFAGMLATLLCTMDSSHILSLLGEIGSGKNRIAALIENGNWFATTLSLIVFELCRVSGQKFLDYLMVSTYFRKFESIVFILNFSDWHLCLFLTCFRFFEKCLILGAVLKPFSAI